VTDATFHLVGAGGIGMSAIARLLLARGARVSGSDVRRTPLIDALEAEGMRVAIGHHAGNLCDAQTVVVSSANGNQFKNGGDVTAVQKPDASAAVPSTATPATDRADLTPENINDAVIRLAGNSQDGIQTAGAFLARLAGRSDHDVMTYMTIPSTISAGPSIFQVRMGTGEVLAAGDQADFPVALDQHSYHDH